MEKLTLALFFLLITKHFVVDFLFQCPYQYLNKGIYGHPGGILHALLHSVTSCTLLLYVFLIGNVLSIYNIVIVCFVEGIIHYHIDWAKMNINAAMNWKCNETDKFWYLLGADQYLHYLTYVGMLWVIL